MGLFIGMALFGSSNQQSNGLVSLLADTPFESTASGNPSSPEILSADYTMYEYYGSSYTNYYYRTSSSYSNYYHVVWVRPTSSANRFYLYLYTSSSYSGSIASSTRGPGLLNWVVVRSSGVSYYYPKVYRSSGTGNAYIKWEPTASYSSIGTSYVNHLSGSDCIEIYEVHLTSGKKYEFTLDVPIAGDYDLYLYYLNLGQATGYSGYYRSSTNSGYGSDETIRYEVPNTGYYALVVVHSGGSGDYILHLDQARSRAGRVILVMLIVIAVNIIAIAIYKKNRRQQQIPRTQRPRRYTRSRRETQPVIDQQRIIWRATPPPQPIPRAPPIAYRATTPPQPIPRAPSMAYCPFCGLENRNTELFCKFCGSEL